MIKILTPKQYRDLVDTKDCLIEAVNKLTVHNATLEKELNQDRIRAQTAQKRAEELTENNENQSLHIMSLQVELEKMCKAFTITYEQLQLLKARRVRRMVSRPVTKKAKRK